MTQIARRHFWTAVHRYCGLAIMAFLAIAAVTGVMLSFAGPIDAALNADLMRRDDGARLIPAEAVARFAAARPDVSILSFPVRVGGGETVPVGVAAPPGAPPLGYDQVLLDRADGHVRGVRRSGPGWDRRHIVQGVFDLHYTLLAGRWGRWLMGIVALGWLIGNLVGLYLTLPLKGAFWKQWKRAWQMRRGSPVPRLMLDLHRASGLWLLIGVTIVAFTSVAMNFFDEAFVPVVNRLSPARPSLFDRPEPGPPTAPPAVPAMAALAIATGEAQRRHLDWLPAKVSHDAGHGVYRVLFTDDGFENYHRLGPVSLYVGDRDGRIAEIDDPYADSAGRKLSRALYPLHTGQVAGPIGIAIDVLLGLATIEMIASGVYLWLKRRRPRVARRRAARAQR